MSSPRFGVVLASVLAAALVAGCTTSAAGGPTVGTAGVLQVVAAENTWGSLAAQLGGSRVHVTSILTDPNADPHEYVTSSTDARLVTTANYVIINGAGYDDWASKLLAASPNGTRRVLSVAELVGKAPGDNPHLWYDPTYVFAAMKRITADYEALAPSGARYFAGRYATVVASFARYEALIADIGLEDHGRPVAATESIFQYMAEALHLDLVTPYPFMKAVAEGYDPPTRSEATVYEQLKDKSFQVLVYNVQTVTPLTSDIETRARSEGIPVIGVSETIEPPSDTFQQWMSAQLSALEKAFPH